MTAPFPDSIAAAQAIPPVVAFGATLAAWPAWRAAVRLMDAVWRRWEDRPITALAAFVLGHGIGAVSAHLAQPHCTIERFKPDGTSAGVMFSNGPCPTDRGP